MGTYQIPRNYKGESRILYIFTMKSLITTAIGALIGSVFLLIFKSMNMMIPGVIIMAIFAFFGFAFGGIKIPNIAAFPKTKMISGEPMGEILLRYIKFNQKKKAYVYIESSKKKN